MKNFEYFKKVVMSSKTKEQIESCEYWLNRLDMQSKDWIEYMHLKIEGLQICNEMKVYLDKVYENSLY